MKNKISITIDPALESNIQKRIIQYKEHHGQGWSITRFIDIALRRLAADLDAMPLDGRSQMLEKLAAEYRLRNKSEKEEHDTRTNQRRKAS